MGIKTYEELIESIKKQPIRKVAVVSAADEHTVEAAIHAYNENVAEPIFIGSKAEIEILISAQGCDAELFEIIHEPDILRTPYIACNLINDGKASFVMKGFIDTSDFLRGIINKENGLRTERLMSHIAFLQIPGYHKLVAISDAGMITAPDLSQKRQILQNACDTLRCMGYIDIKAAVLTAVEKPNKAMPETLDAEILQAESQSSALKGCTVEGPVSYDIAISRESAELKGFKGKHSGDYDIWLVPNISAGNLLTKALIYNGGAKMAGIVVGAKVPLVLNSRSSSAEEKFYAMVLAAAASVI